MARKKKKQLVENKLILNDLIELLDVHATSIGKRIEFFNRITIPVKDDIIFSEDDKNKLTRAFLQCDISENCGLDSGILRKREQLYQKFKEQLPDYSLSEIFKVDSRIQLTNEIRQVYERPAIKSQYPK